MASLFDSSTFADTACVAFNRAEFGGQCRAFALNEYGCVFLGRWNNDDEDEREMSIDSFILNSDDGGGHVRACLCSLGEDGAFRFVGYVCPRASSYVCVDNVQQWLYELNVFESIGLSDGDEVYLVFVNVGVVNTRGGRQTVPTREHLHTDVAHERRDRHDTRATLDRVELEKTVDFCKFEPDKSGHDARFSASSATSDAPHSADDDDDVARGLRHSHESSSSSTACASSSSSSSSRSRAAKRRERFQSSLDRSLDHVNHKKPKRWHVLAVIVFVVFVLVAFAVISKLYRRMNHLGPMVDGIERNVDALRS